MRHSLHRHFVVLPLLALSILGTTASVVLPFGGNELTAVTASPESGQEFTHASGLQGILAPGTQMDLAGDVPVLHEGSVTVAADIPSYLRVGAFTLTAVGGGYYVTKHADTVTVAALSAPVLVSVGSLRVAVPAWMQWNVRGDAIARWDDGVRAWMDARAVTALPKRFLEDQQEILRGIVHRDILPDPHNEASPFPNAVLPELPEALKRRREQWVNETLGVLRNRVETDDLAHVQELLLRYDLADAFAGKRAQSVVAALLFQNNRSIALQQQLLPLLTRDPDLWLLLSLHPAVSTVVWTLPPPAHNGEAEAVRLLGFPFADIGDDAGNAVAWNRWEEGILTSVFAASDPATVGSELIVRLGDLAADRERAGYPERARFIAETLVALGSRLQGDLSSEADAMLQTLQRLKRVSVTLAVASTSSTPSGREASTVLVRDEHFDHAAVESAARRMLQRSGAAFSLKTRVIPVNAVYALVENIVYIGRGRDRTLTFTLHTESGNVFGIHEAGVEYPYALPMEAFLEWIRK